MYLTKSRDVFEEVYFGYSHINERSHNNSNLFADDVDDDTDDMSDDKKMLRYLQVMKKRGAQEFDVIDMTKFDDSTLLGQIAKNKKESQQLDAIQKQQDDILKKLNALTSKQQTHKDEPEAQQEPVENHFGPGNDANVLNNGNPNLGI